MTLVVGGGKGKQIHSSTPRSVVVGSEMVTVRDNDVRSTVNKTYEDWRSSDRRLMEFQNSDLRPTHARSRTPFQEHGLVSVTARKESDAIRKRVEVVSRNCTIGI